MGLFHAGKFRAAETELVQDTSPNGRAFLALARAAKGDCPAQTGPLKQTLNEATLPEMRRLLGLAFAQCTASPADALSQLAELQQAFPRDQDVLFLTARFYKKGWENTVASLFREAPSSYRVNQLSGEIFEAENRFLEAAAEYAKAIVKNPAAIGIHFRRGRALLLASQEAGTLAEARGEFEKELALNADDAAAEYQIGRILEVERDSAASLPHYERALILRPEFPEALIAIGKARVLAHKDDEAISLFRKAAELQPANETAHYSLMLAYRRAGNSAEAAREKAILDGLQRPPDGEFTNFLKKLGERTLPQ